MKIYRKKIALQIISMMMFSLLAISVLMFMNVKEKTKELEKVKQIKRTLNLMEYASDLIHELQKERGRSYGHLGSGGRHFKNELLLQRTLTDKKYNAYDHCLKSETHSIPNQQLSKQIKLIDNALSTVFKEVRTMVDSLKNPDDVIELYTNCINKIMRLVDIAEPISDRDNSLFSTVHAYESIVEGKELTGILRATLSNIFASNRSTLKSYVRSKEILTKIDLYRENYEFYATDSQMELFRETMENSELLEVRRLIKYAEDDLGSDSLGIDPEYWFSQISAVSDNLKLIENSLVSDIQNSFTKIINDLKFERTILISSVLTSLLLIIILIYFSVKKIDSKLAELSALTLMTKKISRGEYDFEIGDDSNDEIKAVTNSFIQMSKNIESKVAELETLTSDYRELYDTIADGILFRNSDGKIISANPSALDILGLSFAQIQGRTSMDTGWKAYHEDGSVFEGKDFPAEVSLNRGVPVHNVIMRIFNPVLNDFKWILVNSMPRFREEKNKPYQVYTSFIDVTDLKNAQEKIIQSEHYVRTYKEALEGSAITSMFDKDGKILEVNNIFCEVSGYTREELIGKKDTIINTSSHSREFWKNLIKTISSGKIWHGELKHKRKDGEIIWVSGSVCPVKSPDGEIEKYLAINFEITKRKEYEQEIIENNNQKDKLFSIIAHDLRGPFTGFLSLTEMLMNNPSAFTSEKIQSIAKMMNKSAKSIYALLEDLLDWSRSQSHNIEFTQIFILLSGHVINIIDLYSERAEAKNIKLINKIPNDISLFADNYMLNTILRNLVSNALKFTPSGGKIIFSCEIVTGNKVKISISDTGVGIEEEVLSKMFRIDSKYSSKGTEGEKGTGLGLLLCRDFVEQHHGELTVESTLGEGSTFSFTMPLFVS
jgi:PAS domain S-box-containing protein